MSSSISKHPTTSPIADVPYDILKEIFIHCLPRYPLEIRQPDITAAPMLLCQICSSWRTVALTSPTLWSHLSYSFTVSDQGLGFGSWEFLRNEIKFLRWWRKNQGSMAPFLHLELNVNNGSPNPECPPLARDGLAFLLKYISSAQYLQTDSTIWELVYEKVNDGYQFICPNLHTIVTSNAWCDTGESQFHHAQDLITLMLNHPSSALRRLSIYEDELPITIPTHWSALTHLSLCGIIMSLDFWFTFIRAMPDLQWACFEVRVFGIVDYEIPTNHVIPRLSTLFLGSRPSGGSAPRLLLIGLDLPALCTLSISPALLDRDTVPDIRTIFQSMPVITKLALRRGYDIYDRRRYPLQMLGPIGSTKPIWYHTPHLKHVQLDFPITSDYDTAKTVKIFNLFVHDAFFSDGSVFAINDPACPIQMITLVDTERSNLWFNEIKDLMMASIQKHARGTSDIIFEFLPQSEDVSFAERWKEWGSRN